MSLQVHIGKFRYLNCGESYEGMIDDRYAQNLSSCEIKKKKTIKASDHEIPCHMRVLPKKKTFKKVLRTSLLNISQNEDDYIQIPVII